MENDPKGNMSETESRLIGLQLMIKEVYMSVLEQPPGADGRQEKNEIQHYMQTFCGHITTSLQQAYGNVSLKIPELNIRNDDAAYLNAELMAELQDAVQSWTDKIEEVMKSADANEDTRQHNSASAEKDYWANRAAKFNTLHQQLNKPQVKRILDILSANDTHENAVIMEDFNTKNVDFTREHAKAKDFVKFLLTLDRQFRNLQGTLQTIEETLPSLLNGLKLIWTISRWINMNEDRFEHILEAISNEICAKVRMEIDIKRIFEERPITNAISKIEQAISVLDNWKKQYDATKLEIEQQNIQRWEFTGTRAIFEKPLHMITILKDLVWACKVTKEFQAILNADLKQVTGSAEQIDEIANEVKDDVKSLQLFPNDVYKKEYQPEWKVLFEAFRANINLIEEKTIKLINDTFKDKLSSSESAFDLLIRFKSVDTRKEIKDTLERKYKNVLERYNQELDEIKELYVKYRDNPPIPKNMPPRAGSIMWVRSLITRIKTPIDKFITLPAILIKEKVGQNAAKKYVLLAKELTEEYERSRFDEWRNKNTGDALEYLQQRVLKTWEDAEGNTKYKVNFNPKLKVIIREAKFLDRIGKEIPPTITNIALQDKDYMMYVDKLNGLLSSYDAALDGLKPVEKRLLLTQLYELDLQMKKGAQDYNWFSLSIKEYITQCKKAIEKFEVTKGRVLSHASNIEKQVKAIENAEIIREIDFKTHTTKDIQDLMDYFEKFRLHALDTLVKDYQNIGDNYLKQIEFSTFQSQSCRHNEMRTYYQYWERRIFNAITRMIIRALAVNKQMLTAKDIKPLIRMDANNNNLEIIYQPATEEMQNQLEKFYKSIIESTKQFGRWKHGTCQVFPESIDPETTTRVIKYTFYDDVVKNPVITALSKDIIDQIQSIIKKFEYYADSLFKNPYLRSLYDSNKFNHTQKKMEKRLVDTNQVEKDILSFRRNKEFFKSYIGKSQPNGPIVIDFGSVYSNAVKEADKWLDMMGRALSDIAKAELNRVILTITKWEKDLDGEPDFLTIKQMLMDIKRIRGESMVMELRIDESLEQFRILKMYEHPIDPEDEERVHNLQTIWDNLVEVADKKEHIVGGYKERFSFKIKTDIDAFKVQCDKVFSDYEAEGPGATQVTLEEGVTLLEMSKDTLITLNTQKEEFVQSEILFNLQISKYPQLIAMEERNGIYQKIYDIFANHAEKVKDFSMKPWPKLEVSELRDEADYEQRQVRNLSKLLTPVVAEKHPPFVKLKAKILAFQNSLPLIEQLRNDAIKERHWNRIIQETGKEDSIGEIVLKNINLQKVFDMQLDENPEVVQAVCVEAVAERQNEDQILQIEQKWGTTNFEISHFVKKSDQEKIPAIKALDDIKQQLEDHIMTLQSVGASKYARSVKQRVAQWEKDLNTISDVIDLWVLTQQKWMYLESIFAGEDIKQQLPDQAKKFQRFDLAWCTLMNQLDRMRQVRQNCVLAKDNQGQDRYSALSGLLNNFLTLEKSLNSYLEGKKMSFPRFYSLSEEDILAILGSSKPDTIQPYLLKLFDACKMLTFEQGGKIITAMTSDEGETYKFERAIKPEGNVEDWMGRVEDEMKRTLHIHCKKAVYLYAREDDRITWIKSQLGMVAILGTQIWWTFAVEDVFRRVKTDKYAMKEELARESHEINRLVALIREEGVSEQLRRSVNCLIILDVHARDIVDCFVRDSKLSSDEFDWQKQLRFYWDYHADDARIRQCTGMLEYCYEYMGLNTRLVITPLTDRCVMTLTTALHFNLGGAPAGPAGTGKTETVRDLAKSLALRCLVTCCGETLDYFSLGLIFAGLIQTGFWGCFDEFNRINREVLSVVATQIKNIQMGLDRKAKSIDHMDAHITLKHSIGIFITMNPGYAGRSELPDNLKALFRPVTMVVPEISMICENMLMSEGFNDARVLSIKMVTLYGLAQKQLSFQWHYEFGLRPIKSVLVQAGKIKRAYPDMPEDEILMRALRDMNMPKFVFEDEPLFKQLLQDLFPGLQADAVGNEELKENSFTHLENNLYGTREDKWVEEQVLKVVQLFETTSTRHTTMVVGPTGGGKSVIINTLAAALEMGDGIRTQKETLNAKSITLKELYGVLDPDSRDWTDGLLSKTYRNLNIPPQPDEDEKRNWLLFDGDVDAIWIENMNSVMDDNRILTLDNGDRLKLQKHCILMFEVFDLQYASPATISRCGMVFVDPKNLGYQPFYQRWWEKKKQKYGETFADNLKELYAKYFPMVMDRIFEGYTGEEELAEPLKFITPRTNMNLIEQLTILIDSLLPEDPEQAPQDFNIVERLFLFCIVWSCGGALVEEDRQTFDVFLHQNAGALLPNNLYDNVYDPKVGKLDLWQNRVASYTGSPDGQYASILVPTMDTTRYAWLLSSVVGLKRPVLFCGSSGASKTVTVMAAFKQLSIDEYVFLNINFSSRTTSLDFQNIVNENIDRKSGSIYGPKTPGKRLIVFIDDMNMPTIDKYGTQQPNALLKFMVARNQIYERKGDLSLLDLKDLQYIGCTTPPAGGNNRVDPRLMSLYCVFNITQPSKEQIQRIYNAILSKKLQDFPEDVQACVPAMTTATMSLFTSIYEGLPRTPLKFHYIFNMRNISSVYEGMFQATVDKISTKGTLIRLWRNECMRIFGDRLISEEDRVLVNENLIPELVEKHFKDVAEEVLVNPILFGDYAMADPSDPDAEDPRLYEDLGTYQRVRDKMDKILEEYNFENAPMNLVLFNEALEHTTKVHRIIRLPRGCALLVGYGGSGKQSVTKLATYLADYSLFTINLARNYKEFDFRMDLQELYKSVLGKPRTFMFTDAHVAEEGFLELLNNILTIGMVPALFMEEEKDGLMSPLDQEIRKKKLPDSKEYRWQYFVKRCRERLHIVLAMTPAGEQLMLRCRNFPGLVSSTTIDWFFAWPVEALTDVASYFLDPVELPEDLRLPVTDHITKVHLSVQAYSTEYDVVYKRKNYSTPKNYLDFILNYIKFLQDRRKGLDNAVIRLEGGLATLEQASASTKVMSEKLAVQNEEISEKKQEVQLVIDQVNAETETASEQRAIAERTEAEVSVAAKEINEIAAEAAIAVKSAQPALDAAQEALKNVQKKDIQEIGALAQPPAAIKLVCTVVFHYFVRDGKNDDWDQVKLKCLRNTKLTEEMMSLDMSSITSAQAGRADKVIAGLKKESKLDGEELVEWVSKKSGPCGGLWSWCVATQSCYDIFKDVAPKKKKAAEMQVKSDKMNKELADIHASLARLDASLAKLNKEKAEKTAILERLEEQAAVMAKRLHSASKLISGLGGEQVRWTDDMHQFQEDKIKLVGDCLSASSFLSYCGPFNYALRQKMMVEDWKKDIVEKGIPNKDTFALDQFLTNDVEVSKWGAQGLPSDELSIQNGILTQYASRWPLCIDPQMQAVAWIKEKERQNQFTPLSFNQENYVKLLENAIKYGKSVLFEGIDTELDPIIDPILEKNIVREAGTEMLTFADNKIEYDSNFRLCLITKIANPSYTPEIFGKTMIINFSVTMGGLRDQLLNRVVEYERPELEKLRKDLISQTAANKAELKELEDLLLSELSKEQEVELVDNEPLIQVLDDAKTKSVKIAGDLEVATTTGAEIERNRQDYSTVAKRGAILFFAMSILSSISSMYEYSLTAYNGVFRNALRTAKQDNVLPARIRFIKETLTRLLYEFVCLGIFEKHKLTFSLQMTTMIMDGEGELNRQELDFFLKGNTSLEEGEACRIPWLAKQSWKDALKLDALGGPFDGFLESIVVNQKKWKAWYDEETPEAVPMPSGYSDKLSKFQQLLVCRVFRQDRVINAIKGFILERMGPNYIQSPPIVYEKIYQGASEKTPIVFVLSPGADPQSEVQRLAEDKGFANKFQHLALGAGMEQRAKDLVERGAIRGHWVMLNNCHLLVKWLKKLEQTIELQTKPDKNFRLWLSTEPTDDFPLGILQKALKVVTEPPDGLGPNIRQNYARLTDDMLDEVDRPEFKSLIYVLAFFHAVIQERKKFGKIGWNVTYDFNDSDFRISFKLIALYLTKAKDEGDENLPWETLRYLIGEAMYGGRVHDNWDRRVMATYLEEYCGDFIFDTNQRFYFSQVGFDYAVPDLESLEQYMEYIEQIPLVYSPNIFGLHSNAEIIYFSNYAKSMWIDLLEMQTSEGGESGGVNREEYVGQVCQDLEAQLPELFDVYNIRKKFEVPVPTQTVLLQELERFNVLLEVMSATLCDLQRALKGIIGMNDSLDAISSSLFNGFVPDAWKIRAPQTLKKLTSWIEHFKRRHQQYFDWDDKGEPNVMWLSGLHTPASYLTALVQTSCRAKGWALDKSIMYTSVTKEKNANAIKRKPDHGCYITGLYLEGARWNMEKECLDYQEPKKLIEEMPLVQVIPVEANKLKLRNTIKTPVYVTQDRKNSMGVGLVTEADLKTDKHVSHWILQGVALVLNTDS